MEKDDSFTIETNEDDFDMAKNRQIISTNQTLHDMAKSLHVQELSR